MSARFGTLIALAAVVAIGSTLAAGVALTACNEVRACYSVVRPYAEPIGHAIDLELADIHYRLWIAKHAEEL
jgi:hypothetical protein